MTYKFSDSSLRQLLRPDSVHPASLARAHLCPLRQGYPYASSASDFSNIPALNTSNFDTFQAPGIFGLSNSHGSEPFIIENLRSPDPYNLNVSRASEIRSSFSIDQGIPSRTEFNGTESSYLTTVKERGETSRKQLEAETYANLVGDLDIQGIDYVRNVLTDATPFSGLDPQGCRSLEDLASGMTNSNAENSFHTTNPHQFPFSTSSVHGPEPPGILALSEISTPRYLPPYINPHNLGPSSIANVSHFSALHHPAPTMTNCNGFGNLNTSTPHYFTPQMSNSEDADPSFSSNVSCIAPKVANTNGLGLSDISNSMPFAAQIGGPNIVQSSYISRRRHRAPQLSNSSTYDPSRLVENMTNPKSPEPPGSPVPRPLVLDDTNLNGPEPAYIFNKDDFDMADMANYFTNPNGDLSDALEPRSGEYSTPQPIRDAGPEVSQPRKKGQRRKKSDVLPADPGFPQKRKLTKKPASKGFRKTSSSEKRMTDGKEARSCTNPSCKASKDNDVPKEDPIDVFDMFTHNNEILRPDFVNNGQVPDASEPQAGHCHTCQPTKDADSEKVPQPRRKYRKRQKSNGLPTGLEPGQKKRRNQETVSNGARKYHSTNKLRTHPKIRYFCLYPGCTESQKGFSRFDDAKRHGRIHEDKKYRCTLPHTNGDRLFRRTDQLHEHIRRMHSDRRPDDPEVETIWSQKHQPPEVKEGVNFAFVQMHYYE